MPDKSTNYQTNKSNKQEWFEYWFNSPYYHLLYQHRDEEEAHYFIERLLAYLQPSEEAYMLDVACGKGRHSRYLAEKGFYVTGIDLSVENISYARQFETNRLSFFTHDMRLLFRINYYDYVFNFFTSFGYFQSDKDHLSALKNMVLGLKSGGYFVLDFLNAGQAIDSIIPQREQRIKGIHFQLYTTYESGYIRKQIKVQDGAQQFQFEEQVRAFLWDDFKLLFEKAGLSLVRTFGDYGLGTFHPSNSERLILIGKKL